MPSQAEDQKFTPEFDVIIIGAGPVGLLLANYLGHSGLRTLVIEALSDLIDYPRGVAIDDESLRAFQAAGVVDDILPHTTPRQAMRYVNGKGRVFASIDPTDQPFGWVRRSTFIQPLADRVSAAGLQRFANVELRLAHKVVGFVQNADGVLVEMERPDGSRQTVACSYMVGCDGGRSRTREALGILFTGKTDPNRWIVVDIADDPMGLPNAYLHADPVRPYACISLPHGLRRLEFMLFPGEADGNDVPRELLDRMLGRVLPDPARVNIIRARVYTHNGRIAERFREGRVILAGDAAHIMPVWQGQGFNSGVRDAFNLGWKLALVVKGICSPDLLDTYQTERKAHAQAMISLSVTAGTVLGMRNPVKVWLRDTITYLISFLPPVKRYFLEMRFKPMPRYREGALNYGPKGFHKNSAIGRMFIQPRVATAEGWTGRMDDLIGTNSFALVSWGVNPDVWLTEKVRARLDLLSIKRFWVVPMTQLGYEAERNPDVIVVGDIDRTVKTWFDHNPETMVLLRPDRFVAVNSGPQALDARLNELLDALGVVEPARREDWNA